MSLGTGLVCPTRVLGRERRETFTRNHLGETVLCP